MTTNTKPKTETEQLFADLDKPSLHALSYALRHPDTWPAGFHWSYNECETCAMGLAHCLWASMPDPSAFPTRYDGMTESNAAASEVARAFGMPHTEALNIFLGHGEWVPRSNMVEGHLWWKKHFSKKNFEAVTPDMVADQIDAYLARAE